MQKKKAKPSTKKVIKKVVKTKNTKAKVKAKSKVAAIVKKVSKMKKASAKTAKKAIAKKPTVKKVNSTKKSAISKKTVKKAVSKKIAKKAVSKKPVKKAVSKKIAKKTAKKIVKKAAKKIAVKAVKPARPKVKVSKPVSETEIKLGKAELSEIVTALEEQREEILQAIEAKQALDLESGSGGDEADIASRNLNNEMLYELSSNDRILVRDIEAALTKIKKGTYGICEHCKKPIEKKRLKFMPHVRYCVSCQSGAEVKRQSFE